jgi:hypothetical protein
MRLIEEPFQSVLSVFIRGKSLLWLIANCYLLIAFFATITATGKL